ncbi:MAG: mannitol dehydrogenase family protein, partial [Sphaerochaetaceae bacterium]
MELNAKGIEKKKEWEAKGFEMPSFEYQQMVQNTLRGPIWIHFGAGNIFRGFPASLMQTLLNRGLTGKGIVVGEGFDYEIIDEIYKPHDNISLLVTLKSDGTIAKKVIASVAQAMKCDSSFSEEWNTFKKYFAMDSLEMVSFTITEKGYALKGGDGAFFPFVTADLANGPDGKLNSMMSKVTALLYARYLSGKKKLALCSMDNCSHNGEKLQNAVMTIAQAWVDASFCEKGFIAYLQKNVSFPWSM